MVGSRLLKVGLLIGLSLLLAACGSSGTRHKIAVVNWQQAAAAHPKAAALEKGEKVLRSLQERREYQAELAGSQLSSVNKLRGLRQLSQESYLNAEFNSRMAELREVENEKLEKFVAEAEAQVDAELAPRTKAVEDTYQLEIFNLRARLESVRIKPDERKELEAQMQQVQRERGRKVGELMREKQGLVDARVGPYKQAMYERLNAAAARFRSQARRQIKSSDERDEEMLKAAPKALSNILLIMDKDIAAQEEKNSALRREIEQAIETRAAKLAGERGYKIVFKEFKVNVAADDITPDVIRGLKE